MTTTTTLTLADKVAIVADVLDLGVDHDIDLCGLVLEMESAGKPVTDELDDNDVDELLMRAPAFTAGGIE